MRSISRSTLIAIVTAAVCGLWSIPASATDTLCDPSYQNCRDPLMTLINNEKVGIDVAFWFMQDARYDTAIVNRWKAGVPVRILVDPRANSTYTGNSTMLSDFASAGIPMRKRVASGILHWKMMLFAGQNTIEFGSANYSPNAFVPNTPYGDYVAETVYTTDDPSVVNSFKTKYDDSWTDTTSFADYANISGTPTRIYPTYTIDPDLNFPPTQSYAKRAVTAYNNETQKIDAIMYRITDRRHADAIINAKNRGVPVRMIVENIQYHNRNYLWDAWNVDRLYAAGVPLRWRGHAGENHEKVVLLYGQGLSIFGSSNWTTASDSSQQEHNYFTTKSAMFTWFQNQFERMWNNTNPNGVTETVPFVPLPPDRPSYVSPANATTGLSTTQTLTWYGGPWGVYYDVYFGTSPAPPLLASNLNLGPSTSSTSYQKYQLPTLFGGTTYYWQIVSRTNAGLTATGPVWSFTTSGTASTPPPAPGATTVVLWASNTAAASIHGNWQMLTDSAAAGGAALWNPDQGAAKIAPALASPTNYWEQTFTAYSGTAYHLWVRLRAQNNSFSNDSIHVQFSDSVDPLGTAVGRIGTPSSNEVLLQAGSGDPSDQGYGWIDNGWGSPGSNVYFATTGTHTIRIQQREDGAIVDQIVLSPDTYLSTAPGPNDNDATILPATSGTTTSGGAVSNTTTVVLWAANVPAGNVSGNWQQLTDSTAAGGSALWNPDSGQAKISPALASPANDWQTTFTAAAGTAYHLWVRLRAQNNSSSNDSVDVQFNDSVDSSGTATMQIGTTSSAEVILQNGPSGTAEQNWGWADNGWGTLGVNVYFATSGIHTLRIQQREDGAIVDQIVLSPNTYLTSPPGPRQNDTTILTANSGA